MKVCAAGTGKLGTVVGTYAVENPLEGVPLSVERRGGRGECPTLVAKGKRHSATRAETSLMKRELKEMVLALFNESDLELSDDVVETIVDQTFRLADSNGDGKIDPIEWNQFVKKNPSLLKNMTLPYLQ
ncbi:Calcineurin B-like protein 7 [Platanthera guangdongensis]|uniref:Calcineurin B-like protein n=1 Tax=Platanthera guangdongensis TaxID=2320717 RepID=A0ABR2LKK1_9ASPA